MKNYEIKVELMKRGMKQYELASLLGISEWTLSRKLRTELPDEEKQRILEIIRGKEEGV
jgi:predicted transcriptional regulator